jgi:hypothetical protein
MLFRKNIEPRCSYCARSVFLDNETIICNKKGVNPSAGSCHSFRYDPLKRVPYRPITADFSKLKDEDFSL